MVWSTPGAGRRARDAQRAPRSAWTTPSSIPDGKRRPDHVRATGPRRIWNAATGCRTAILRTGSAVAEAEFSLDGSVVATASEDGVARIWDAETGRRLAALRGHGASVTSLDFSPDSRYLVTDSDDKTARVWEVRSGRTVAELRGQTQFSTALFSADGALVLSPDFEAVRAWEAATGRPLFVLRRAPARGLGRSFQPGREHKS